MASASMLAPPAQPAMMVRQPIGLAPGMSSLAPPQMAPSMGQGMYGAPTMGMGNMYPPQQMGGGPPQQMGGGMYPGANMPMQPPPGGFQPQQNGYGGFPPSGYPPRGM